MATESKVSHEVEIESKKIQVGKKNYYIDLKENQKGRFIKFVEVLFSSKANRIVIPMSVVEPFLQKLVEVKEFVDSYEPKEVGIKDEKDKKFAEIVKSAQLFVLNRRFYFDIKEVSSGRLLLRISLVSSTNRINISIVAEAVTNIVDIIRGFVENHPSDVTTPNIKPAVVTPNQKKTPRSPRRKQEPIVAKTDSSVAKLEPERKEFDKTQKVQKKSLQVATTPGAEVFTADGRTYTFELVTGENRAFIRICEQKNYKKSTFHIPLDLCEKWKDTYGTFVKGIPESAIAAAVKAKTAALVNEA